MLTLTKDIAKKTFLILIIAFCIPLFGVVAKVIYTYGTYVGTYARVILEEGICR